MERSTKPSRMRMMPMTALLDEVLDSIVDYRRHDHDFHAYDQTQQTSKTVHSHQRSALSRSQLAVFHLQPCKVACPR